MELIAVYSPDRLKSARVAAAFSEPSGRIFWATSSHSRRSTSDRGLVRDRYRTLFSHPPPTFGSSGTVLSRPPIGTVTRPASRDGPDVEPPTLGQHDIRRKWPPTLLDRSTGLLREFSIDPESMRA